MSALGFQEILIIFFIIGGIAIVPYVFYLIELQNTLKEVKEENRKMNPGQVWLLFIPLFSIYWYFEVVNKIADSLKAEFEDRNIQVDEERPGFTIGNVLCILGAVSFGITVFTKLLSFLAVIMSILSVIVGITSFILFIMYWVKINGYRNKLIEAKRAA